MTNHSAARRHIGIVIFEGVEELDAVGPWQVFADWAQSSPEDGWTASCVSRDGAAVSAAHGLRIGAQHAFDTAPQLGVLLLPGGHGKEQLLADPSFLEWVRAQRAVVPLMTSVCTGALVYAAAGILRGRPATTHWAHLDRLHALDPTIDVRPDARFVDDGDLITSAGVSAGIDMALHVVGRLAGAERAAQVRREIQYDVPAPVLED